ncbi:5-methyltetrahydropteroyltriglutamate--homocysteine S-methyltransferase [Enterococcus sp. AZ103]|uniref:5-methyltetrahydropteroyltriglutamate-- homocysteine S-methyltransferase n=1 Tax=Enterococcus sp. AZ103 TaxID=2774628 RepID=UPI003F224B7E
MCKVNRYEIVGSFLRPEVLKEARAAFEAKEITQNELTEVENTEIKKLVEKQKAADLNVFSDGEFRRSYWHLDFFWGLNGVEHNVRDQGYLFQGEETRADSARLDGKIAFNPEHPVFEEFSFLTELVPAEKIRHSIPAPAQLHSELVRGDNADKIAEFYDEEEDLYQDIAKAYRETILHLYELGARQIKLDDCTWGMIADENYSKTKYAEGFDLEALKKLYVRLNNDAIVDLPEDLSITTHVCRGNYHSTWAASGGYEAVGETLFGQENADAFFLEYDDDRSGDFAPLRNLPADKKVVLGLITSKNGQLEDKQTIIDRIKEASQYVSLDRISLSPQCGFASTEEGNILTEEDQWKKLQLVKEITEEIWG